jgi:hypothetical protein
MTRIVRLIGDHFFVRSDRSNKIYTVNRNMQCSCKGFFAHRHCRHQKAVENYIKSGEAVDIARTPVRKYERQKQHGHSRRIFIGEPEEMVLPETAG